LSRVVCQGKRGKNHATQKAKRRKNWGARKGSRRYCARTLRGIGGEKIGGGFDRNCVDHRRAREKGQEKG